MSRIPKCKTTVKCTVSERVSEWVVCVKRGVLRWTDIGSHEEQVWECVNLCDVAVCVCVTVRLLISLLTTDNYHDKHTELLPFMTATAVKDLGCLMCATLFQEL